MLSNRVPQAINPGVKLKDKLILFLKIEALTLVIGLSFILRHVALGVIKDKKAALVAVLPVPFMSSAAETLKRFSAVMVNDQWLYLLPFYGACLFAIRIDLVSRSLRDVFLKWSLLFFIMEFTTEWTKYGWDTVSADLPVQLARYLTGGLMAAGVWWLMERSPRLKELGQKPLLTRRRTRRSVKQD